MKECDHDTECVMCFEYKKSDTDHKIIIANYPHFPPAQEMCTESTEDNHKSHMLKKNTRLIGFCLWHDIWLIFIIFL